jgi:cytochrome c553
MNCIKSAICSVIILASNILFLNTVIAQDIKGNVVAGKSKNSLCIGCHGIEGYRTSFPALYTVPMIAGQNSKYIENALKAYKSGERTHPTMRSIATSLTEQDMADLAAYYAAFKRTTSSNVSSKPDLEVATTALKNNNCASCHGADYAKSIDGSIPSLAGQHADYLVQALKQYRAGDNKKAILSRNHPVMTGTAKKLSIADINHIALHLSKLPNGHLSIPEAKKGITPE